MLHYVARKGCKREMQEIADRPLLNGVLAARKNGKEFSEAQEGAPCCMHFAGFREWGKQRF